MKDKKIDKSEGKKESQYNRQGTVRTRSGKTITLSYGRDKAIKLFCTECLGWEVNPADCTATMCPLFQFRGRTLATNDTGDVVVDD